MVSPWVPLGGRASWDNSVGFWQQQIKQMMMANIDVLQMELYSASGSAYEHVSSPLQPSLPRLQRAQGLSVYRSGHLHD